LREEHRLRVFQNGLVMKIFGPERDEVTGEWTVLCGCETWSLILREEQRLRVFENGVMRKIFGPERYEVTGEWRRLHNEELNDLYFSPDIIRVIISSRVRWEGHVARIGRGEVHPEF
jgi:hypothetical protein